MAESDTVEARLLLRQAYVSRRSGDLPGAERAARRALSLIGPEGSSRDLARAHYALAVTLRKAGRINEAIEWHRSAAMHYEFVGDPVLIADNDLSWAITLRLAGHAPEAEPHLLSASAAFAAAGKERRAASSDHSLGILYRDDRKFEEAERRLRSALAFFESAEVPRTTASAQQSLALLLIEKSEWTEAKHLLVTARQHYFESGLSHRVIRIDYDVARLTVLRVASAAWPDRESDELNDALLVAVGAALAHDGRRFDFPTDRARAAWAALSRKHVDFALSTAVALDRHDVATELISDLRSFGRYQIQSSERDVTAELPDELDDRDEPAAPQFALAASGAACRVLGSSEYSVARPPLVETRSGSIAARVALDRAAREYGPPPLRSARVLRRRRD